MSFFVAFSNSTPSIVASVGCFDDTLIVSRSMHELKGFFPMLVSESGRVISIRE